MKTAMLTRKKLYPLGKDVLLCTLLLAVFAAVSFFNLGDTSFPKTSYNFTDNEPVFIDFGQPMRFQGVVFLNGGNHNTGFRIYSWDGGDDFHLCHEESRNIKFRWLAFGFDEIARYVVIEPLAPYISILEMGFLATNAGGTPEENKLSGSRVSPALGSSGFAEPVAFSSAGVARMFDESRLIPQNPSYMNDMNFDESLHAVTAYEFLNALPPTEWTHPPLGKSIIAMGIDIFGMTPFGWRFMSAIFGLLMIIPIYALGRFMFGSRLLAFLAALVFTFDFMHFVQARVATLDTFLVTFIICMYLFMYKYIQIKPDNRLAPKSLVYLALSGIFMGLAISVKWQGMYAGLGLGVLFAIAWFESRADYIGKKRKRLFTMNVTRTALWCVLFFIFIPIAIYCLSYIPFSRASGLRWPGGIIKNQSDMFNFHSYQAENNDYQSRWWTWPLNLKPIYYYRHVMDDGKYRGINSFGNPALWWGGFLGLVWCVKRWIANHDKTARFLCIAWAAQILPWVFISRATFIYHYYPCVPFLALIVAYFVKTRTKHRQRWYALSCCAVVLIMFAVFYPTISGMLVNINTIERLQWLPGWRFIGLSP